MTTVSIIVPIYNAASTLVKTLGNLVNQTLGGVEVILIDDASTDGSYQIMQDARGQFPDRVRIIRNEKNAGPGVSRNRGIEVATGEYLGFVDADDVAASYMYEKLYTAAKKEDADIADCAYIRNEDEGGLLHFSDEYSGKLTWGRKSGLIAAGGYHATKIFRRSLIMDNDIRYTPAYRLEDLSFLIKAIYCADRGIGVPEVMYYYSDNAMSLSHLTKPFDYIQAVAAAMADLYEKMSVLPHYDKVQLAVECMQTELAKDAMLMTKTQLTGQVEKQMEGLIWTMMNTVVKIPPMENRYTVAKIPVNDINVVLR